jgi:hypothetical protein
MEIAIYFEGGGTSAETKAALRLGMSAFLKPLVQLARERRYRWSITSCGSRNQTVKAFLDALEQEPDKWNLLVVDSESLVQSTPREHLVQHDKWNLASVEEDQVHLMAQCMETWLVADPEALAEYYKQEFNANALPKRTNLEEEPKDDIYAALEAATRQTRKGKYGKIKDGSELLKRVNCSKTRTRCAHCDRLFTVLTAKIQTSS